MNKNILQACFSLLMTLMVGIPSLSQADESSLSIVNEVYEAEYFISEKLHGDLLVSSSTDEKAGYQSYYIYSVKLKEKVAIFRVIQTDNIISGIDFTSDAGLLIFQTNLRSADAALWVDWGTGAEPIQLPKVKGFDPLQLKTIISFAQLSNNGKHIAIVANEGLFVGTLDKEKNKVIDFHKIKLNGKVPVASWYDNNILSYTTEDRDFGRYYADTGKKKTKKIPVSFFSETRFKRSHILFKKKGNESDIISLSWTSNGWKLFDGNIFSDYSSDIDGLIFASSSDGEGFYIEVDGEVFFKKSLNKELEVNLELVGKVPSLLFGRASNISVLSGYKVAIKEQLMRTAEKKKEQALNLIKEKEWLALRKLTKRPSEYETIEFTTALSKVPKGFLGHDLKIVYDAIDNGGVVRGQFETKKEYAARIEAYMAKPFYKKLTINALLAFSFDKVDSRYDIDNQELIVETVLPEENYYAYDKDAYPFRGGIYFNQRTISESLPSYNGSNAFGISRKVIKYQFDEYNLYTDTELDLDFYHIEMDTTTAKEAVDKLSLLVIFRLEAPYVGMRSDSHEPTIGNPYDTTTRKHFVLGNIKALWFYNKKTGEVYQKRTF